MGEGRDKAGIDALTLEGVGKRYGEVQVLDDVSLRVATGEFHALIGPNGAGKSSLFNVISGLTPPSAGRVRLRGRDVTGLPAHRMARLGLSRSFQVANVFGRMSVFDNLRCAAMRRGGLGYQWWCALDRGRGVARRAHQVMAQLDLERRAALPAGELSYAEQRALELGMVLATEARVVLLDEPTAGMSRAETARMMELIRGTCRGRTVLIVEHDMQVVFGLSDRISVMVQGRLIATGEPEHIRADPAVRQAYLGGLMQEPE
ncbi:ABC transporter ATP-binding protein [Pigmentiphaga kullae]|uniref:Amino acid/amide ABC transporter ATP-binding protein 1 (HAAT family) n=1 Tax=Pigmentiphaga kullae TaxID=151784 RepID=A0A4Q7NBS8_9BURK|nr:ABC transporter ATP-binding protein [Pigmentiphaga kullae]RZS80461.1 amino acid/amide ABC transporter ATP-binding protein 1 (HAAT family) [Pigmentiphaga kullae]